MYIYITIHGNVLPAQIFIFTIFAEHLENIILKVLQNRIETDNMQQYLTKVITTQ